MNTHDIDIELPPLPSPFGIVDPDGTEGMMHYTIRDLQDYAKAYARTAIEAALQSQSNHDTTLFCDLKTDEEKCAFFLSGRGYETGVIAQAIQHDVAMAYHRCAEYKKELEALQSQDREDAQRFRKIMNMTRAEREEVLFFACDRDVLNAIDHARRVEGDEE